MPFVLVLPLIVIGIVIAATKKAAEQNKRAEAQRRAEQMQTRQAASTAKQQYTPVKPSVQIPTVREAATTLKPTPTQKPQNRAYQSTTSKTHPQHDDCSLRPDSRGKQAPPWQHPEHEDCSLDAETAANPEVYTARKRNPALQANGTTLDFTPDNIVRGVLFSEIFGKPKALR